MRRANSIGLNYRQRTMGFRTDYITIQDTSFFCFVYLFVRLFIWLGFWITDFPVIYCYRERTTFINETRHDSIFRFRGISTVQNLVGKGVSCWRYLRSNSGPGQPTPRVSPPWRTSMTPVQLNSHLRAERDMGSRPQTPRGTREGLSKRSELERRTGGNWTSILRTLLDLRRTTRLLKTESERFNPEGGFEGGMGGRDEGRGPTSRLNHDRILIPTYPASGRTWTSNEETKRSSKETKTTVQGGESSQGHKCSCGGAPSYGTGGVSFNAVYGSSRTKTLRRNRGGLRNTRRVTLFTGGTSVFRLVSDLILTSGCRHQKESDGLSFKTKSVIFFPYYVHLFFVVSV